jgi:hypothetical protein
LGGATLVANILYYPTIANQTLGFIAAAEEFTSGQDVTQPGLCDPTVTGTVHFAPAGTFDVTTLNLVPPFSVQIR